MSTPISYSIRRNPNDLIFNVISLIVLIDALYLIAILSFIGIRNTLGLDATLLGLNVFLFIVKTCFTIFWSHKLLASWLRVDYYVLDDRLVLEGHSGKIESTVYILDDITGVVVKQQTSIGRKYNFGTIEIAVSGQENLSYCSMYKIQRG